jgi:hypothetical protein
MKGRRGQGADELLGLFGGGACAEGAKLLHYCEQLLVLVTAFQGSHLEMWSLSVRNTYCFIYFSQLYVLQLAKISRRS